MTLRWIEGVEANAHATHIERKYRAVTGSPTIGLFQGRSGQHCLRDNIAVLYTPSLSSTSPEHDTWIVGFAFKMNDNTGAGTPSDTQIAGIEFITDTDASPTAQLSLQLNRVDDFIYRWVLKRGNTISSTTIDTSSNFWANKWYYFEIKVKIDPSTGTYELRQDGSNIMSGSGTNTAASGDSGMDSIAIHMDSDFGNSPFHQVDDLYVLDTQGTYNNDFLGDCHIEGIYPDGDGDVLQWDPSLGGSHYVEVDETTNVSDDDKVTADAIGEKDLFDYEDLTTTIDNIRGIQISTQHAMQTSGSRSFVHTMRDISNNDNDGSKTIVSSSGVYSTATEIVEKEPQGGSDWTKSDLDDYQFGVKVTV